MNSSIMDIDDITLDKLISDQAKKNPDKIAIMHNGQTINYHNLDSRSNQVAAYFKANKLSTPKIFLLV